MRMDVFVCCVQQVTVPGGWGGQEAGHWANWACQVLVNLLRQNRGDVCKKSPDRGTL